MSSSPAQPGPRRTSAKSKARQLAEHLRAERPDYAYLKEVFRHLRAELGVEATHRPPRLPYVPTEVEIRRYYETVWEGQRDGDVMLIKTLLYTGMRIMELVAVRIDDVDLDSCLIAITRPNGVKDRVVGFPATFREPLAAHVDQTRRRGASHLFESSRKKPYSARGVRALLARYARQAGFAHNVPPHRLRHLLFSWLETQGIDDALGQRASGIASS